MLFLEAVRDEKLTVWKCFPNVNNPVDKCISSYKQLVLMSPWMFRVDGTGCNPTPDGRQYKGHKSITVSGRQCQAWASQSPHGHSYTDDDMYPDASVEDASNYCRNPDSGWDGGIWCYTTDPDKSWELCSVITCGQSLLCCITHVNLCRNRMLFHASQIDYLCVSYNNLLLDTRMSYFSLTGIALWDQKLHLWPNLGVPVPSLKCLSLIHIWRCRRIERCRSRWSPYH